MNPVMFNIGKIEFRWYSFFILIAVLLGFVLALREAKKNSIDKDLIFDIGFYTVIFGILGARVYYVLFNLKLYQNDFIEIFRLWNGGLAIHGGIIAGLLTIFIFSKVKKVKMLKLTDIVAPSLILGQAIGRWGNFFNSEAHGPVTTIANLQNLKFIPNFIIKGMKINGVYYHPTFYYEFLWCMLGFIILLLIKLLYKNRKDGQLTCVYLMWYSAGRYFIESLRTDSLMFKNFKVAQIISIILFIISFVTFFIILFKKDKIKEEKKEKATKKKKRAKKVSDKAKNKKEEIEEESKEKELNEDIDKTKKEKKTTGKKKNSKKTKNSDKITKEKSKKEE